MGRVVRLVLLCFFVWVIAMVILFPAAPVIEKIKPQLQPLKVSGVSGKVYSGTVASVVSDDDLLPLVLSDVKWTFSPLKLLKGTGAAVKFSGLGGGGTGDVLRTWGGDLAIDNVEIDIDAPELEVYLPVPIATFKGKIRGEFPEVRLVNERLTRLLGELQWSGAEIDTNAFGPQLQLALGNIVIDIQPQDEGAHETKITASGGDIAANWLIIYNAPQVLNRAAVFDGGKRVT